jgi:hypothetical protein
MIQKLADAMTGKNDKFLHNILDVNWKIEDIHERDCAACDIAAEVAGTLGAAWDTDDTWNSETMTDGVPGDSRLDQVTRIVAFVLHRRLLGIYPSLAELKRLNEESRARRSSNPSDGSA